MLVLTFQVGAARLALDLRQVHEVVPRVQLERVAGSPAWLAGMFIYRGRVVPVIDLHRLLGAGECPAHLSSRIVLVPLPGGALMGLLAAGEVHSDAVARGIEYLLQTQNDDGTWDEAPYTGTGFPRVFYLKYYLYRIYFPLMALGRYNRLRQGRT